MLKPSTGRELIQFVSAIQWLRSIIPNFAEIIHPLIYALERSYSLSTTGTKRDLQPVILSDINWGQLELDSLNKSRQVLRSRVTLSHRDENKRLYFYFGPSEIHWDGIATKLPSKVIHLPQLDKRHEPLAFFSAHFTQTQL